MGWIYLPGAVSDRLPLDIQSRITEPSVMSRTNRTAKRFLSLASRTDCLKMLLSGTMSEHSMVQSGVERWILSLEDSPASPSLWLDNGKGRPTSEIYGLIQSESLARYDPDTHSLRTSQVLLALDTLKPSSVTLPKSGMIVNGTLLVRPTWVLTTEGNGCGYWPTPQNSEDGRKIQEDWVWCGTYFRDKNGKKIQTHLKHSIQIWPTPTEHGNHNRRGLSKTSGDGLATAVKMWPTPKQSDGHGAGKHGDGGMDLRTAVRWPTPSASFGERGGKIYPKSNHDTEKAFREADPTMIGGKLNPQWVEWLMGWPSGWTDLKCLGMDGFRRWLREF